MSAATEASRAFAGACGENDTRASIPARPRSRQRVESVVPNPTFESFAQYDANASWKTPADFSPRSTIALLACTYSPRQVKFVDPHTTTFPAFPSTTIVLLCWRLLMCWRLTWVVPADVRRRAAALVSAE